MAEIHGGRGEFELAEKELQEVLRLQPENPHAHFRMGLIRLANGERDRAEEEFRRAVAEDRTYLKKVRRIVGDEFLKR
jgi:Tfp pilus assembly protein PilF